MRNKIYFLLSYTTLAIKYWWAHFTILHTGGSVKNGAN